MVREGSTPRSGLTAGKGRNGFRLAAELECDRRRPVGANGAGRCHRAGSISPDSEALHLLRYRGLSSVRHPRTDDRQQYFGVIPVICPWDRCSSHFRIMSASFSRICPSIERSR